MQSAAAECNYQSDHSLRLFEYLPIGTPETKHSAIYYLENCTVVPYSTDVRPCCFTLKMRNGTELRFYFALNPLCLFSRVHAPRPSV